MNTNQTKIDIFSPVASDKICLVVYGNISSGKSEFVKKIRTLLPGYKNISLDEIRIDWFFKHPDMNGIARERKCEEECLKSLHASRLIIYETTAATLFYDRTISRINSNFKTVHIYINCPSHICQRRYEMREKNGHFAIPLPYKKTMTLIESMNKMASAHSSITPDLQLDSSANTTEELVEVFKQRFNWPQIK